MAITTSNYTPHEELYLTKVPAKYRVHRWRNIAANQMEIRSHYWKHKAGRTAAGLYVLLSLLLGCGGDVYPPVSAGPDTSIEPLESDSQGAVKADVHTLPDSMKVDTTASENNDADTAVSDTEGPTIISDSQADSDIPSDDANTPNVICGLYQLLCEGQCTNYTVDALHCGSCGNQCSNDQVCSGGVCTTGICAGSESACNGTCVNLQTHSQHCGACDSPCPDTQQCVSGMCAAAILNGFDGTCDSPWSLQAVINGNQQCLSGLAEVTFGWALCSCEELGISTTFRTDGFNSLTAPYAPGGGSAHVGSNTHISASALLDIGGDLHVSGPLGLTANSPVNISGTLSCGGAISLSSPSTIEQDAFVAGNISVATSLTISGTLTQPGTSTNTGTIVAGETVSQPVSVQPPCSCTAGELLPIPQIAEYYALPSAHQNDTIGLQADALIQPNGPVHLNLPCGIYYLDAIQTSHGLSITSTGRSLLIVGGNVSVGGQLNVHPMPGGELDIFIAGTFRAFDKATVGAPSYPAATRLYLGGQGDAFFDAGVALYGMLHTSQSTLKLEDTSEIYGALAVYRFQSRLDAYVHYDQAVLQLGTFCTPEE